MDEELLIEARHKLAAGRIIAMKKMPYYSKVLLGMSPNERIGLGTFAVDERWRMYYDPQKCLEWTVEEIAAVWLHEAGHVMRGHSERFKNLEGHNHDNRTFNCAADAAINSDLREMGVLLPNPEKRYYAEPTEENPKWRKGMTSEEMYYLARSGKGKPKDEPQDSKTPPPPSDNTPESKPEDNESDPSPSPDSKSNDAKDENEKPDSQDDSPNSDDSESSDKSESKKSDSKDSEQSKDEQPDEENDSKGNGDTSDESSDEESSGDKTNESDSGESQDSDEDSSGQGDNPNEENSEGESESDANENGSGENEESDSDDESGSETKDESDGKPDCGSAVDGKPRDYESKDNNDGSMDKASAEYIKKETAEAIVEFDKSRPGVLPGSMVRDAKNILEPQVDWRDEFAALVRHVSALQQGYSDYSYSRPSRRSGASAFILPAMRQPPAPEIAIILDTSGSMDEKKEIALGLAEMEEIINRTARFSQSRAVKIINCDAADNAAVVVQNLKDFVITGGGGTDMRAGISAAAKLKPRVDIIITITDGYTPWPKEPPMENLKAHYIVLLVGRNKKSSKNKNHQIPPWMKVVEVNMPDKRSWMRPSSS